MRGSLTFSVTPDQQIAVKADLYEMTDFDLLRMATALIEQGFKLNLKLIEKTVEQMKAKQVIAEAAEFKKKVDENHK